MSRFTYLYLHTHFSRDGGPSSPAQWCRAASDLGYKTLGVSDRGPLAAFPVFSKAARVAGVQPVYSMEADILLPAGKDIKAGDATTQPAVFFARDRQGLDNLARLASLAYARWPAEEHALDWEAIAQHSAGLALVLLSAGGASNLAAWGASIKEYFGDAAYVGLAHPGGNSGHIAREKVIAAAEQMQLPTIAMPAARYICPEDKLSYQALQVARRRAGWAGDARAGTETIGPGTQYLLSPEEIANLYAPWPEALENAARLAETCGGIGYLDDIANETFRGTQQAERSQLQGLAEERLLRKLGTDSLPDAVRQWLDDELTAYERQNILPAWSALVSISDMARSHDGQPAVPLGAPLGTADGSLLAYAFGISPIDPTEYPRPVWLSTDENGAAARVLPVPGVELPANRRDELLVTLARALRPDRAVLAACHIEIDPLTALLAASEVLNNGGDIRPLALQATAQGWNALADRESDHAERLTPANLALSLRGAPIAFKPDPDMLLVAPVKAELTTWLPVLQQCQGQSLAWVPVTEEAAAEMRLPAVMLRPSSTLAALASTLTSAAQYPVPGLAVEALDLTGYPELSTEAMSTLAKGELAGIPYLSAGAMKGWKGEITPAAATALVARSASTRKPPAAPALDQWTEKTTNTGGALLYRDQFEALVEATAGFSPAEAYLLRALLLKGNADEDTPQMKAQFGAGCAEHGLDAETTETLWQALSASAPDLQSRCSMAVRARTAMWAAFFKAEHPAAFLVAHLSVNIDRGAVPVPTLVREARRLRVGIKPPDASHSMPAPTLERGGAEWTILWGLALLPGWSREVAARFVAARPKGGFRTMADFAQAAVKAGLTLEQLETLVRSGACDTLGEQARSREALLAALPEWLEWATLERAGKDRAGDAGPADLFSFNDAQSPPPPDEKVMLSNTPATPRERYLRRMWEVEQMGVAFTPAEEIESLKRTLEGSHLHSRLLRSIQVGEEHVGKSINLVGLLTCIRLVKPPATDSAAPGDPMAVAWVEDTEGAIELVAFPPGYKRHTELWTENNLVIITGRVRKHEDGDIYLLCEHMAAFEAAADEAEISVKVKQSKKAQAALEEIASPANAPSGNGANGKDNHNSNGNGAYPAGTPSPAPPPATKPATIPPTTIPAPSATPVSAATMTNTATTTTGGPPDHKIIITLPITEDDKADIDRMITLKRILQEHPGTDVVTLRIPFSPEPGHLTTAQLPRGVSYSAVLEAEVVRLLGTEAIAVIRL